MIIFPCETIEHETHAVPVGVVVLFASSHPGTGQEYMQKSRGHRGFVQRLFLAPSLKQSAMRSHTCPKDFVENRNISNILEEAPPSAQ